MDVKYSVIESQPGMVLGVYSGVPRDVHVSEIIFDEQEQIRRFGQFFLRGGGYRRNEYELTDTGSIIVAGEIPVDRVMRFIQRGREFEVVTQGRCMTYWSPLLCNVPVSRVTEPYTIER